MEVNRRDYYYYRKGAIHHRFVSVDEIELSKEQSKEYWKIVKENFDGDEKREERNEFFRKEWEKLSNIHYEHKVFKNSYSVHSGKLNHLYSTDEAILLSETEASTLLNQMNESSLQNTSEKQTFLANKWKELTDQNRKIVDGLRLAEKFISLGDSFTNMYKNR